MLQIKVVSSFYYIMYFNENNVILLYGGGNNIQEKIPIEEVFEQLKCTKQGLSTEEGEQRLQIFGPNKLEEKKVRT